MYENLDRKTKKSRCLKNTPRRNYDRCQHPSFDDHQSSITVFDTKKMWMKIYGIDVRRFRPVNFFGACWKSISLRSLIKDDNSTHPHLTPYRMVTVLKHDLNVVIFPVCTQHC
ncbi:uncharacterized protein LOC143447307 isoform X1 [Clavelina lepadiformis]|uniref:uncharacterized protein LOC143447307 isoform X1 n=1 Tax=Clavelina lepadiformis TaxID=159417 RepID=UPI004041B2E6